MFNYLCFLLEGVRAQSQLIGPSSIVLEHGTRNMLPSPKVEACFVMLPSQSFPLHNLYTWKLNHGQTIWEKKCSVIANLFRNTLGTSGTSWEFGWNTFRTKNKFLNHPLRCKTQKTKKKLSLSKPSLCPCEVYIFKTGCHHFQLGLIPPL